MVLPHAKKSGTEKQNIKVVVRTRPLSKQEEDGAVKSIIKYLGHKDILAKDKRFQFDRVFKSESNQLQVYQDVVSSMIPDVLSGYNCTVFAYGQTGSGKTYTMSGNNCETPTHWEADSDAGIIPRAAIHIFHRLSPGAQPGQESVKVSYLELYNEEVRDLLSDYDNTLNIYNDSKGSVFIQGLTEISVFDAQGICAQLIRGNIKRQTAPTLMNHQSSRSHTVFTITVSSKESTAANEEVVKTGKINFVDLAGSENIARSGCKEMRAVELANINKSLLTLGRVIHILADKTKRHVPYRESKLTRILQDSLGGHTKTCIIATISPASASSDETLSTLEYASRARDIKNCPTVNEKLSPEKIIEGLREIIKHLELDLEASRNAVGFYINGDHYQTMLNELENLRAFKLSIDEIMNDQQKANDELKSMLHEKSKEYAETLTQYEKSTEILKTLQEEIQQKTESLKRENFVACSFEKKANFLHKEVEDVLKMAKSLSEEACLLQNKLEKQYSINKLNEARARETVETVLEMVQEFCEQRNSVTEMGADMCALCQEDIKEFKSAPQLPTKELEEAFGYMEKYLIKNLQEKINILSEHSESLSVTNRKISEIRDKLSIFITKHGEFVSEQSKDITGIFERFQSAVHKTAEQVDEEYSKEDEEAYKMVQEFEQDFIVQQKEEQIIFTMRQKKNQERLKKINDLKRLIKKRSEGKKTHVSGIKEVCEKFRSEQTEFIDKCTAGYQKIVENIPRPQDLDALIKRTETLNENMVADISKLNQLQATCSQELDSLKKAVTTCWEQVTQSAAANFDSLGSRFTFLMEDRQHEHEAFDNFTENVKQALCDNFLGGMLTVQHEGDTPARPVEVKRRVLGTPVGREKLLQKFNALLEEEEEDKENIPGLLNTPPTSSGFFKTPTSTLDKGGDAGGSETTKK